MSQSSSLCSEPQFIAAIDAMIDSGRQGDCRSSAGEGVDLKSRAVEFRFLYTDAYPILQFAHEFLEVARVKAPVCPPVF